MPIFGKASAVVFERLKPSDLKIGGNGVISTSFHNILKSGSAQKQIKALKHVKIFAPKASSGK